MTMQKRKWRIVFLALPFCLALPLIARFVLAGDYPGAWANGTDHYLPEFGAPRIVRARFNRLTGKKQWLLGGEWMDRLPVW